MWRPRLGNGQDATTSINCRTEASHRMQEGRRMRVTLHPDLVFENPWRAKWTKETKADLQHYDTSRHCSHSCPGCVATKSLTGKWSKVSFFFDGWSRKCMLMLTLRKKSTKAIYMDKCKQGAFVISTSPKWRWHSGACMHHGHSAPFLPSMRPVSGSLRKRLVVSTGTWLCLRLIPSPTSQKKTTHHAAEPKRAPLLSGLTYIGKLLLHMASTRGSSSTMLELARSCLATTRIRRETEWLSPVTVNKVC